MTPADARDEFVMVPVPTPLYASVIQLIANHQATATGVAAGTERNSETPDALSGPFTQQSGGGIPTWSRADFAALAQFANPFTRAILDLCAQAPDQWIRYRDAVKLTGIKTASARSQLGGLTKLAGRLFPNDEQREWPFEWDLEPGEERQLRFRLDKDAAHVWTAVSRGGDHA